jgi:hypothetical protein
MPPAFWSCGRDAEGDASPPLRPRTIAEQFSMGKVFVSTRPFLCDDASPEHVNQR